MMSSFCTTRVLASAIGIIANLLIWAEVEGAGKWSIEASAEYILIDGVMDHAAQAVLENEQEERWAPRVEFGYRVSDRWSLNTGFVELRDLKVTGFARCSTPWLDPGEGCRAAITPMRLESDLQQFDFGLDRLLWSNDRSSLTVGVLGVLSVVSNSRFAFADRIFFPVYPTPQDILNDRFVHDETQWDFGTRVIYTYELAENWSLNARYRLSQPPGRTFHHIGFGLGAKF